MQSRDYGPFDYVPIVGRPKLTWPGGAHVAVWVITNIEFFPLTRGLAGHPGQARGKPPSVRAWGQRDYGNRVGVWRILDLLEKLGVPGTATVNSDIFTHHPEILKSAAERGWEFMGHNETNSVWLSDIDPAKERALIARCAEALEKAGGRRPTGWLGAGLDETWDTLDHLVAEGFDYVADWVNDDQPYMMNVDGKDLVAIPYSYELNDSPAMYYKGLSIDDFETMIRRQFEVLYEEGATSGRVMAICLHPYIIGVPHRIKGLERALAHIKSHDKVWFATGHEIVQHYLANRPGTGLA